MASNVKEKISAVLYVSLTMVLTRRNKMAVFYIDWRTDRL